MRRPKQSSYDGIIRTGLKGLKLFHLSLAAPLTNIDLSAFYNRKKVLSR